MRTTIVMPESPAGRPKTENPEFFKLLEASGIIDKSFIRDLLEEFDNNALDVLATLIQSGVASKRKLCQIWCNAVGIAHVDLEKTIFQPEALRKIPERIARKYYAIAIYQMGDTVTVATATPDNNDIRKILEDVTGGPVSLVFALPQDIEASIEKEYTGCSSVFEFFNKLAVSRLLRSGREITGRLLAHAGGPEAINQLHVAVILYGVTRSASEIRITGGRETAGIDFVIPRGDDLHFSVEKSIYDQLIHRLFALAHVSPADTAAVRCGRILIPTPGKKIDLKFESSPGINGPAVHLTLTGPKPLLQPPKLDALFLSGRIRREITSILKKPQGHILVAGPRRSGKSTLAYAMLRERSRGFRNILTAEETIKHLLPGINQFQTHTAAGITAARLFDAGLEQKGATFFIQNIETPEIPEKVSAAVLSKNFIISGMHAENAITALEKAIRIGAASTVTAVLCQRLAARLCDTCKIKYTLSPDQVRMIFETNGNDALSAWRENGCPYCNESGFSGLIGIHELLIVDAPVKKMMIDGADTNTVLASIKHEYRYTMHYDGIKKVLRGLTTFDEIHRISD